MDQVLQGVTILCFAASYAVALGLELLTLWRPGAVRRWVILVCAAAGFFAHSVYLLHLGLPLRGEVDSLLALSWILTVFYLVGSIHHRRLAWGVFVLPVVLALVLVAWITPDTDTAAQSQTASSLWVWLHTAFMLLGAVGLCVAFMASVMLLVQSARLRHKKLPGDGSRLLSLERLETMNRRAIDLAFPLFTFGLALGFVLLASTPRPLSIFDPKILATAVLWLMFLVVWYLRHGLHLRGRRVAWWTVLAFVLLVWALMLNHFDTGI
jgi:ABC-type uncharacterized transport system permease subunit